jgi:hypothetical protein
MFDPVLIACAVSSWQVHVLIRFSYETGSFSIAVWYILRNTLAKNDYKVIIFFMFCRQSKCG